MRIYSYIFHGLLALFLLGISSVALASGNTLRLEMLPWSGSTGTYLLLFGAVFGLLSLLLALKRKLRFLFFVWSLGVFALMVKGFFLSPYRFSGPSGFRTATLLTGGALLAILGAWFQMTRRAEDSMARGRVKS